MVDRGAFAVPGFRAAGVACGMRYKGRPDLALIAARGEAAAAGVFTTNQFQAAPVELCRRKLEACGNRVRAVLINAGIANACTGKEGRRKAEEMAHLAAGALEVSPESVLVASTGVIGPQIVMNPLKQAMPGLVEALELDGWKDAARAIMTTDTVPKLASTKLDLEGREVTIGGIAKGSGMIAPRMATLLGFVCTDAAVAPHVLTSLVRQSAARSFNAITIDGDTSTNDTLLAMAGGAAGNPPLTAPETPACRLFAKALEAVFLDLACQIVRDGEGATKFIEVAVTGAESEESARAVAFTVANSPLVKTAFFGEDANWGRIIAAAGRAGVPIEPEKVVLHFGDVCVFQDGGPVEDPRVEAQASEELRQKDIRVRLDLGKGPARFTAYTSDLSYDYVKINADYRT